MNNSYCSSVKKRFLKRSLQLITYLVFTAALLRAQSPTEQVWFEYMLNYPFAKKFNLENAFTYSTLISKPRWWALDYAPTLEYALSPRIDLMAASTFSYTLQSEDYNSFEIRPMLGTKIHITPYRRINLRLLLRFEMRNIKNLETKEWQTTFRPRSRGELLVPFNQRSMSADKLWYGLADVEWFFAIEDVEERFANRFRVRAGLGYRVNYGSRFEFIYTLQKSKNSIDDDFYTADNIFRFRYKHYLRKHKPTTSSGTGN
ncbi:DUF2490 domain-containing protein [Flavitalea sp.]|nr:DUF2490 domain-containing protein [Flavitalea sp.]